MTEDAQTIKEKKGNKKNSAQNKNKPASLRTKEN